MRKGSSVMRNYIICAVMIAVLLVSHVTFGEIIYDETAIGVGSSWGTNTGVRATGANPEVSTYGGGYQSYYTTEGGTFSWYYELYARTSAVLNLFSGNTCKAYAYGIAIGEDIFGEVPVSADSDLLDFGYGGEQRFDPDEPDEVYQVIPGTRLDPNQGVSAAHYAYVETNVVPESSDSAYAMVEATAWCSMY
jgi:hypothetical protein